MPQESPTDETPPPEPTASSETTSDEETPKAQTVEEVEATWRNRVSGKDKAHAAEVKALRDQITERDRRLSAKTETDSANSSESDQWKQQYEAEVEARKRDQETYVTEVRSAKYPYAAEALDAMNLVTMDEGKLAALNVRLSDEGDEPTTGGRIDPNAAPKRQPTPPKSDADKSVAELEADLKRQAPAYADTLK